jgi:hypothetical protein
MPLVLFNVSFDMPNPREVDPGVPAEDAGVVEIPIVNRQRHHAVVGHDVVGRTQREMQVVEPCRQVGIVVVVQNCARAVRGIEVHELGLRRGCWTTPESISKC